METSVTKMCSLHGSGLKIKVTFCVKESGYRAPSHEFAVLEACVHVHDWQMFWDPESGKEASDSDEGWPLFCWPGRDTSHSGIV